MPEPSLAVGNRPPMPSSASSPSAFPTENVAAFPRPRLVRAPDAVADPVPPRLTGADPLGLTARAQDRIRASTSDSDSPPVVLLTARNTPSP